MLPWLARPQSIAFTMVCLLLLSAGEIPSAEFSVADSPRLTDGAMLRVMSFNILSEEWNDQTPVHGRQDTVAKTILHFTPDVVGLQEVSATWYSVLPGLLSENYEMVQQTNAKGEGNYTGMAYHREKAQLLESGTRCYSIGVGGTKIRLVTWGHFRHRETGATFLVMNTHWCIRQENRMVHAQEMAAWFSEFRQRFGCPVITVGDHNAGPSNEAYQRYAKQTGLGNARVDARAIHRAFRTSHSLGKKPKPVPEDAIDQIFFTEDLTCLFYNVLIDQVILDASDHCPIYADFALNRAQTD